MGPILIRRRLIHPKAISIGLYSGVYLSGGARSPKSAGASVPASERQTSRGVKPKLTWFRVRHPYQSGASYTAALHKSYSEIQLNSRHAELLKPLDSKLSRSRAPRQKEEVHARSAACHAQVTASMDAGIIH